MGLLSRGSRRVVTAALIACVAMLLISGVGSGGAGSSVAHAAAENTCSWYTVGNSKYGFWDAAYDSQGETSCGATFPHGFGYIYPCSGVNVTANMDAWLTQSTVPGGARLAESGRTGNETWAPNCAWNQQVQVIGWGQYSTTPLWACLWTDDVTVNLSFDYLCARDY
jgi:hypothetical protein